VVKIKRKLKAMNRLSKTSGKAKAVLIVSTLISLNGCASATVINDYCLVTDPFKDLTLEGMARYDCLCSEDPIDPECKE
tara:strand:+ start:385 stop:621 length:237 start_codon:yes stop_codon:yes gene_type:complete